MARLPRIGFAAALVAGVVCGGLAGHADVPDPTQSVANEWASAQSCMGTHVVRDQRSCQKRCTADHTDAAAAPGKGKKGRRARGNVSSCRCQCTSSVLNQAEKSCGELGLVDALAELGAGARACVNPRLSDVAACVLRCDDVLETCVSACDDGISSLAEPTEQSCMMTCFAFQRSCLSTCNDKAMRPASLNGSHK